MAGPLQKTIMRNAQGQLVETTTPVQKLTQQAGLQAPPITPLGTSMLGGNEHQQKMAGTPAQKTAAQRQASDTTTTWQQAQADKKYRTTMSQGEQDVLNKQRTLAQTLGGAGERVQNLLDAEIARLAPPAEPATAPAAIDTSTIAPAQQAQYNAALAALGTPGFNQAFNELVQATGMTEDQLAAQLDAMAAQQGLSTAGQAVASRIADRVTVGSILPQLGMDQQEIASLLGISPDDLANMSMGQLSSLVDQVSDQTRETDVRAGSALLGAAERAAERERSKELSTSGVAATEAQLQSLASEIGSADTVQFGGRTGTWEELLSDDSISQVISDYLLNPDSPESRRLAADPANKLMLDFIERHRDALTDVAASFKQEAEANKQLQESVRKLQNPAPGVEIPDSIMRQIYPDWNPNVRATGSIKPKGLAAALADDSIPAESRGQWLSDITSLLRDYPDVNLNLANIDAAGLRQLFSPVTGRLNGITPFQNLRNTLDLENKVRTADAEDGIDDILTGLFGGEPMSEAQARELIQEDIARIAWGMDPLWEDLDADRNGKLDRPSLLRKRALKYLDDTNTPEEALRTTGGIARTVPDRKRLTEQQRTLYDTIPEDIRRSPERTQEFISSLGESRSDEDRNMLQMFIDAGVYVKQAKRALANMNKQANLEMEDSGIGGLFYSGTGGTGGLG